MPEPSGLPFGVLTRGDFPKLHRSRKADLPGEVGGKRLRPQGAHDGRAEGNSRGE